MYEVGMGWATLGDSMAGTSHRARSVPCQDAFRFSTFGEWLVIAVADGAGSSLHSDVGATLACDEFIRRIPALDPNTLLSREGMTALFTEVQTALFAKAERIGVKPREVACTALLAVIGPTSAAFAQHGDGAIVIRQGEDYRTVFWPEPAEYANATDFLTDDSFPASMLFETVTEPIAEVAAFTDGLQRVALDFTARTAYPAFFRPLFNEIRAATDTELLAEPFRRFLDSDRVNERTDDDKTLVLAVRHP
ncbi:MAG TPA: PP2C family serine/threonine-protein phosphatase [Gemmataceae bacterium]|nr:PP2C family serine/threonine-protein phosphatase [Gemmataceae bacterium]